MATPTLSICVPTYNRLAWLERALLSVTQHSCGQEVEIIVSDNSTEAGSAEVVERCLADWPGPWTYLHNQPSLPRLENENQAFSHASGAFVMMLHDDDYFLPGGLEVALSALAAQSDYAAYLFGVHVVSEHGRVMKRQLFRRQRYLLPRAAVAQLLSDSSFVRLPAIIIKREVLNEFNLFNPAARDASDFDLWLKIFLAYGVMCLPITLSAYTVHRHAATMTMFNTKMLDLLLGYFDDIEQTGLFSEQTLAHYKSLFFHQYILAGVNRSLRWQGPEAARVAFGLFAHDAICHLNTPAKWWSLRRLFTIFLGPPHLESENSQPQL